MLSSSRFNAHCSAKYQPSTGVLQPAFDDGQAAKPMLAVLGEHFLQGPQVRHRLEVLAEIVQLPLTGGLLNLLDQPGRHGNELPGRGRLRQVDKLGLLDARQLGEHVGRAKRYLAALHGLLDVRPQAEQAEAAARIQSGFLWIKLLTSAKVASVPCRAVTASMIRLICRAYSTTVVSGRKALA